MRPTVGVGNTTGLCLNHASVTKLEEYLVLLVNLDQRVHARTYVFLSPFTPQHRYAFSPYCSLYIFQGADKENLFINQKLVIISFILVA